MLIYDFEFVKNKIKSEICKNFLSPVFLSAVISFSVFFIGCKVYSFTGASISPNIKTVSIQYFQNHAPVINPTLSQVFTEMLKDKFTSQTNLNLINGIGDLNFEGEIVNYSITPQAVQGNQTAALSRLTITIHVKFTNSKEPKQDFDLQFSNYEDFASSQNIAVIENDLIKTINTKIIDDIFNKSVANW